MIRKKLLALALCAALPFVLAGCGNGKVESTVSEVASRLGNDVSETVSRVESAVESFFDMESSDVDDTLSSHGSMAESRLESENSALDGTSSILESGSAVD